MSQSLSGLFLVALEYSGMNACTRMFFGRGFDARDISRWMVASAVAVFVIIAGIDVAVHWTDLSGKAQLLFSIF